MKKIIIFGGTTEARKLATALSKNGIYSVYCVATEYGKQPVEASKFISIHDGRMDAGAMLDFFNQQNPDAIVDATHPFAEIVKKEILSAVDQYGHVPFFRLARETEQVDYSDSVFFDTALDCARALKNIPGKIFLTTGSKELPVFCEDEDLKERIVARIIPNEESLKICSDCGLKGSQIIAMQGPFSMEMNLAFIKETEASTIVLKESGKSSGEASRVEAAKTAGIKCFIIKRPAEEKNALSFTEVLREIYRICDINEDPLEYKSANPVIDLNKDESLEKKKVIDLEKDSSLEKTRVIDLEQDKTLEKTKIIDLDIEDELVHYDINVTLAGYGMGFGTITEEVQTAVENADYIFGAPRMLYGVDSTAKKEPYYLAKDILPRLSAIAHVRKAMGKWNVVVLFSGDTGFFSGAAKLSNALKTLDYCHVTILPGISSISAFAARLGVNWQTAVLMSSHGVKEDIWLPRLIENAKHESEIFMLTTSSKDVRIVGETLVDLEVKGYGKYDIAAGFNLYSDENIIKGGANKCARINEDGLCTLYIKNTMPVEKRLAPGLRDDQFLRDKIPMSKEEIRSLSICKLGVTKDSVVYDIGSGSGSVAVEIGLLDPSIFVYAIELNENACALIEKNIQYKTLKNIKLIPGIAPDAMEGLPAPEFVFIGGSAGRLAEILQKLKAFETPIKVVINAVTIETIAEINNVLKSFNITDFDLVQISVSKAKKAGDYSVMQGQNPVYIATFSIN
ncbi:MAG: precorrin-6A reductase [Pseudobutyrivibrio sp.]|nr:precorrin-6A reductase [Pseudobutyrivibrio sp.]